MSEFVKCIKCGFRYVTDKARENFEAEGLKGEPLLCLHCIGALTGKVMNSFGYLVYPEELESSNQHMQAIPKTIVGCRPCMKKRG
ncbi:hypothetical protein SECTIM467_17 [Brevibacillus phage SecTim467]|uniref:Uncharacterized protein n=2 Tax=Jenstvirus jenst TaxID=1982225 RepID=A0A0K2CNW3_9CAUD|nr:hypothetical protein AVV11_gp174 [Brevibacillus phage Jenst]ALA07147.1 hypothetical protein JENST_17 [Brevibacillus phage Jenst]ALA07517.1 hypothetical protein SECTIM467_17 [Brevibacillus phage SecTim467]